MIAGRARGERPRRPGHRRPGVGADRQRLGRRRDGKPEERPVTLGLTDGEQVEVREGLAEGEQVLQFVPVPDDTPIDPTPANRWAGRSDEPAVSCSGVQPRGPRCPTRSVLPILTGVDLDVDAGEHVADRRAVRARASRRCSTSSACSTARPRGRISSTASRPTGCGPGAGRGCAARCSASSSSSSTCCRGGPPSENVAAPLLYARGRAYLTRSRAAREMLDRVGSRRPGRPGARAAVRRRAAAGGDRPGAGPPSAGGPRRRAHRCPGRRDRCARDGAAGPR